MKKLISTVAALAVVVSMGATAFAGELPSPTTTSDITATPVSLSPDYYEVEVGTIDSMPADVIDDLKDTVSGAVGDKEVAAIDVCTIVVTNKISDEDIWWDIDESNPVKIAFAFDGAQNVIAVLEYDEFADEWIEADFEIVDGKVEATLTEGWLIAFATEAVKADDTKKDDGKGSAQTGYDMAIYVASAVALAAGAVFFFATSKKTAKDVK